MKSTLDFDSLRDMSHVESYTVHDLTKKIKKQKSQIEKIAGHLGDFKQEHKGIWVYPEDADTERRYSVDKQDQFLARQAAFARRIREAQCRDPPQS